jgi:hypothetical protein
MEDAMTATMGAIPYKRWTITLDGDWEDGWVASATSRLAGEAGIEVTTAGQGWGADRGGLPTPADALNALTKKLAARRADSNRHPSRAFAGALPIRRRRAEVILPDGASELRNALTDDVMRDILMVTPPPPDFAAYRDAVRERIVAALVAQ